MTVEALRAMGHDVSDIRGTPSERLRDDVLWEVAQREERLLITTDKGFAHYRMGPHHGILMGIIYLSSRHMFLAALAATRQLRYPRQIPSRVLECSERH